MQLKDSAQGCAQLGPPDSCSQVAADLAAKAMKLFLSKNLRSPLHQQKDETHSKFSTQATKARSQRAKEIICLFSVSGIFSKW